MDRLYGIEDAAVVSDIIEGEAVMLHRVSGDYFSTDGVGCLIWQWIGEGHSHRQIVRRLQAGAAASPTEVEAAVDAFIADLVTHSLVREIGESAGSPAEVAGEPPAAPQADFRPPVLNVYSDIRNLLLLDPLHDTDEKTGWPERKPIA